MIMKAPSTSPSGPPLPGRMARAAAAGLLGMAVLVAMFLAAMALAPISGLSEPTLMILLIVVPGAVSWAALHLFRVRPAWPVVIVGALFVVALWWPAYEAAFLLSETLSVFSWVLFVGLLGIIAYAAAVLVISARRRVVWGAVLLALLAMSYWLAWQGWLAWQAEQASYLGKANLICPGETPSEENPWPLSRDEPCSPSPP
ncbi:hypothetical protein [Nonomuraea sp. B19D2]|uniref:hypothetical protein n=1 Tax=Nonomuraea sp. B19D2 TaxID=3159561 RepID=UPI0032DADF12